MILSSTLRREKRDSLQMTQVWFRNVLEEDEWSQYWILVEVLNEDMMSLKNWSEIWIRSVIDFITNAEDSSQFARQTDVIFEDSQEHAMIQILIWETMLNRDSKIDLKILLKCWMTFWLDLLRLSLRQKREIDLLWSIDMFSNWLSSKKDDFNVDVVRRNFTDMMIQSLTSSEISSSSSE